MSDQTNGGADTPLPQREDPDTVDLHRPLWEAWSEDEQGTMAAALGAAREALAPEPEAAAAQETPAPAEPDLAAAGVLATGETVTADELAGMPWYEARVEIYVRNGAPGPEYGQGGDKIAHTRAATQAPSFAAAAERLDADLGPKWQHLLQVAPLADQAPTPDPDPVPPAAAAGHQPRPASLREGAAIFLIAVLVLIIVVMAL